MLEDPEAKRYFAEMLEDAPAQQLPRSQADGRRAARRARTTRWPSTRSPRSPAD